MALKEGYITVYMAPVGFTGNYFEACIANCQGQNPTLTPTATSTTTRTPTSTATGGATESTGEASTNMDLLTDISLLADASPQQSTATLSLRLNGSSLSVEIDSVTRITVMESANLFALLSRCVKLSCIELNF